MSATADPARTHALLVGVGSCRMGKDWNLDKAAPDALSIAEWLKNTVGVPAANIHLFLSDAERKESEARVRALACDTRRAVFAAFADFVTELRRLSGDLLFFYWAGHSNMDSEKERFLFLEDWSDEQLDRSIDLNLFFRQLRSVPFAVNFLRQVAYIDACANYWEELGFAQSLGGWKPSIGKPVDSVEQRYFLAADSGRQAKAGEFSRHLINALREQFAAGQGWPPAQDDIVKEVREHFTGLEQRPIQMAWVSGAGDETNELQSGDLPASDFVNAVEAQKGVPVLHLRRLAVRLAAYAPFEDVRNRDSVYQALAAAARVNLPETRPGRRRTANDLLRIVASAFYWGSEGSLPAEVRRIEPQAADFEDEAQRVQLLRGIRTELLRLVPSGVLCDLYRRVIAALSADSAREHAGSLSAMLDELCVPAGGEERFLALYEFLYRVRASNDRLEAPLDALLAHATPLVREKARLRVERSRSFRLRITVDPHLENEGSPSRVEARLFTSERTETLKSWPPENTPGWEDVERAVRKIAAEARSLALTQAEAGESALAVEFLLPLAFLGRALEDTVIPLRGAPQRRLGQLHPVVVRWRERFLEPDQAERMSWQELGTILAPLRDQPASFVWLKEGQCSIAAGKDCLGVLALEFAPVTPEKLEALWELIWAGFPYIAWLRQEPADWAAYKDKLREWGRGRVLRVLPEDLWKDRRTPASSNLPRTVSLFWDDPDNRFEWKRTDVKS